MLLGDLHCGCVTGWNFVFSHCGWSVNKSRTDLEVNALNIHVLTTASVCLFQCGANLLYHSVFVCADVPQTCLCLNSWIKHAAWWKTHCTICGASVFISLYWMECILLSQTWGGRIFFPVFSLSCLHPFICSTGNSCPDLKAGGNSSTWSKMRPVRAGRVSRTLPNSHCPTEVHKEVSLPILAINKIFYIYTNATLMSKFDLLHLGW